MSEPTYLWMVANLCSSQMILYGYRQVSELYLNRGRTTYVAPVITPFHMLAYNQHYKQHGDIFSLSCVVFKQATEHSERSTM